MHVFSLQKLGVRKHVSVKECRPYLTDFVFVEVRYSDHVLMIETGRYRTPVIPRASRFCPHCLNKVEDEQHFLTDCVAYDRSALMARFSEHCPQFERLDNDDKFIYLMSQEDEELTKFLALSLHKWMMQRLDYKSQTQEVFQYIILFTLSDDS